MSKEGEWWLPQQFPFANREKRSRWTTLQHPHHREGVARLLPSSTPQTAFVLSERDVESHPMMARAESSGMESRLVVTVLKVMNQRRRAFAIHDLESVRALTALLYRLRPDSDC